MLHPLGTSQHLDHYFIEEMSAELTAGTVFPGLGISMVEYYR